MKDLKHLFILVSILAIVSYMFFNLTVNEKNAEPQINNEEVLNGAHLKGPGDVRTGYDDSEYKTQSLSLDQRKGVETDLVAIVKNPPLGLPPLKIPQANPITIEKVALGKKLFFDRRLSINDTFSCAMCHIPEQGFTNNEMRTAVGVEGRSNLRNAPTIYNVAYYKLLFQDGREFTLENQIWQPILNHTEMAAPSIGYIINKIRRIPDYDGLFESAFDEGPTVENIGQALASYERTLLAANSPFDRWYFGKEENAISESAKKGFLLFMGKANCSSCHTVNSDYALFTDNLLHNTGVGYKVSMGDIYIGKEMEPLSSSEKKEKKKVQLAPGVFVNVDKSIIDSVSQQKLPNDLGLYSVTENPNDRWKFRTSSLRNVELTAPYMHNGIFSSLEEVIDFYNQGGIKNELLSPLLRALELKVEEKENLLAFLLSLTGGNVPVLVADAFTAPIGDIGVSDPNWANKNTLGY